MKGSLGRALAALIVASTCATACADLLGVSAKFGNVVDQFCKCDGTDAFWPKTFEGEEFVACEDYVRDALAANPEAANAWIAGFDDSGCQDCGNALACAQMAPLCVPIGAGPCDRDELCCGYDPLVVNAAYCGYQLDPETNATIGRTCVSDVDPEHCLASGALCDDDSQCCGSAGRLGACLQAGDVGFCIVVCDPDNPIRCPGCCAIVDFAGVLPPLPACVEDLPFAPDVEDGYCNQVCVSSCPLGLGCGEVTRALGFETMDETLISVGLTVTECIPLP